jgi:hypothetical protein
VEATPPTNGVATYSDETVTGFKVSVAGLATPPYAAEIVTVVGAGTLVVVILNFADVAPAATVTLGGTVADPSELVNVRTAPPDGAGPLKYTVFAVD